MGWRQMVIGAVVGQIAEWMRERKLNVRPFLTGQKGGSVVTDQGKTDATAYPVEPPESERAIGGKLNPLNATEDMLKRVIDHAQFRTDQSARRALSELQRATEKQWPLMAEQAQLAADMAIETAAKRLEGASGRIAEDVASRASIVLDEKLARADAILTRHREEAARQGTRLLMVGGGVALVVGAGLIVLAAALF